MSLKIAFGMIVFEGDYVLESCLESVYPYATQILISEGPVGFWQHKGRTTSLDKTNEILKNFPDPENKITVVHGQFAEKDEQCNAYMKHINDDIDYVWNLDSDEVYKQKDIETIISLLEKNQYTSVSIRSASFFGGFDRVMSGFEEMKNNFMRIFRVCSGATWLTHRPPTIKYPISYNGPLNKHLDSEELYFKHGIQMYHYSYTFPLQVKNKLEYYKAKVSKERCVDDYYENVYVPWVNGDLSNKFDIEMSNGGVHEFKKETRIPCYTKKFIDGHPSSIEKRFEMLNERLVKEINELCSVNC